MRAGDYLHYMLPDESTSSETLQVWKRAAGVTHTAAVVTKTRQLKRSCISRLFVLLTGQTSGSAGPCLDMSLLCNARGRLKLAASWKNPSAPAPCWGRQREGCSGPCSPGCPQELCTAGAGTGQLHCGRNNHVPGQRFHGHQNPLTGEVEMMIIW